ncbi:OmpP1/FadL family transporter [Acinetobacter towneri]|uniref:OmpP1/FadL family transporter n=1 Tax=Acinetobacter towneri TaxID=202956 RepID=UPI001F60BEC1|nr:outer membrane protein transport protein [Acinetobacter towneri]MCO8058736.1 outer membrane protein transport protein [Acinetobacter towneri]MCO8064496.1 outer membrane protein transport protein [Acinetobacter towneri]MDD4852363.1 outer membrane protein transport protein [Acinetobacter towneri]UNT61250.1 outer membrane protein transport protein [Acinetobacter towneri]
MKLKALSTAMILATVPMTGAFAAGMDRSGQSIAAFLQPGNYFEAGISVLDPSVSGTTSNSPLLGPGANQATGDMASDYYFPSAALKFQVTDNFSFGLLYDRPFGAEAEYSAPNAGLTAFSYLGEGTSAEVKTENLTFLFGFQPNQNWNFYAGPVYQTAKGNVSLRGTAYSALGGVPLPGTGLPGMVYDADMKEDSELGWIAGLAYQIPEIALKASLTYRSEVEHELTATETLGGNPISAITAGLGAPITPGKTAVTTPQSVNLDFQTGIMADTVAFANVRWVDWKGFAIRPNDFGQLLDVLGGSGLPGTSSALIGGNLVEYNEEQWSATVGVGRKFNEKWAGNVSVGWDSGAGNPVTTLGPTEGYWNVGLGLQFSPAPNYFIAGGVKYFWLGDATALTVANPNVGEFTDNHAIGYGLKMGYRF